MKYYADEIILEAIKMYGINEEKWNNTLHKSFSIVRDTNLEELFIQQIIHYLTVNLGAPAYIPSEKLDIPELEENFKITVIRKMTKEEVSDELAKLLLSGCALSKQTIEDILVLSDYIKIDIDEIKNRELKIALYNKMDKIPKNAEEFIKYLFYRITDNTCVIKNLDNFYEIKRRIYGKAIHKELLEQYINSYGYKPLAQIFNRYKKIFLALKDDSTKTIINKISKLSKKYHIPKEIEILDRLTSLDSDEFIKSTTDILNNFNKVSIFRLIRIYNSIEYRLSGNKDLAITVRNGKVFVKEEKEKNNLWTLQMIKTLLIFVIKDKLAHLKNKKIYIPSNIKYIVPTSEKQFIDSIPCGSVVSIERNKNLVVGISWSNLEDERVDLDLHGKGDNGSIGWNTSYNDGGVYFSGDITDAPNGANEVFFVSKNATIGKMMLDVTKYTDNQATVPFKFVIAEARDEETNKDYVINPNEILAQFNMEMDDTNKNIGEVIFDNNTIKVIMENKKLDRDIHNTEKDYTKMLREIQKNIAETKLDFNTLFKDIGAILVENKEEADIDLSLDSLDKTTFISLLVNE